MFKYLLLDSKGVPYGYVDTLQEAQQFQLDMLNAGQQCFYVTIRNLNQEVVF